jgi:glycosyltransferase involved in cell wall biosynthesis
MDLKMWCSVVRQRTIENPWVVHSGLATYMAWGFLQAISGRRKGAIKALSQVHRTARISWFRRLVEPYIVANRDAIYLNLGQLPQTDLRPLFGNRLMVLKAPASGSEKGVLFVMVNDTIRLLCSGMDMQKLLDDYTLVFEPSWSGYCHPELLEYTRWNEEIFVLTAEESDFAFLTRLGSNLVPVGLGPCDWVDPRAAEPYLRNTKEFDIVMNSNWGAWKRHYVLFHMLRNAKQRYKVALIGVHWSGKTRDDIVQLAHFYGVTDQLAIFDWIPYQQVMDLTCGSKVSILLSLKEGSNRAIAESIFCNVPVVVLSNHVGGIRKNIVPETGLLAEEANLESAIAQLLESNIYPREWGLEHVSCFKSTEKLNATLREYALKQGRPWTQDIAVRSNSPESSYLSAKDAERLLPWNEGLKDYLSHGAPIN